MKKILIADDSFFQRKMLADLVTEMGYAYETVGSGEELLEKVNESHDCIFLDLLMSGMSGIDVLTKLKERSNPPPVIVISADIQKVRREECMALGARAFINKVVSKQELQNAIDQVFN
jgi:CheY-like chemotaxis protein